MKKPTVSKTISLPVTFFAMAQQIMDKKGMESFEECIGFCVSRIYTQEGFGIP